MSYRHAQPSMTPNSKPSGRGSASNPKNRFEDAEYIADPPAPDEEEAPHPRTQFIRDDSQSLITYNTSPDVGFDASFNVYRGCEHGCAYCFARPTHEYLGMSAGLDFETKIMVKESAPELLRRELAKKSWKPQVLAMSGVTDCYQPVERVRQLTRRCVEVLAEFRNPLSIITKNHLVTRDKDLLAELARFDAVVVNLSVTTLDGGLAKGLQPHTPDGGDPGAQRRRHSGACVDGPRDSRADGSRDARAPAGLCPGGRAGRGLYSAASSLGGGPAV